MERDQLADAWTDLAETMALDARALREAGLVGAAMELLETAETVCTYVEMRLQVIEHGV